MLFCHKLPAGIYHSQGCKVYSGESDSVNWHTELIWENQALLKNLHVIEWLHWVGDHEVLGKGRQCDVSPSNLENFAQNYKWLKSKITIYI